MHVRVVRWRPGPELLAPVLRGAAPTRRLRHSCCAIDDDRALLVLGGCDMVKLGIESGDPQLREQVIGKPVSDADVTAAVEALKQRGIGVQTVAFLGLPGETPETAAKTLAMSVALRPSHAHALLMADEGGSVLPECEALWRLLPVAARFPFLESRVRDAASKPREALDERVFQWNHDLGFLASGEVGPLDIARMALGMRGHS